MEKSKLPKWTYAFDCKKCMTKETIGVDTYCIPAKKGLQPIHADDDRIIRCDYYKEKEDASADTETSSQNHDTQRTVYIQSIANPSEKVNETEATTNGCNS